MVLSGWAALLEPYALLVSHYVDIHDLRSGY